MSDREEEMIRAINERARRMLEERNRENTEAWNEKGVEVGGKSYADFKAAKKRPSSSNSFSGLENTVRPQGYAFSQKTKRRLLKRRKVRRSLFSSGKVGQSAVAQKKVRRNIFRKPIKKNIEKQNSVLQKPQVNLKDAIENRSILKTKNKVQNTERFEKVEKVEKVEKKVVTFESYGKLWGRLAAFFLDMLPTYIVGVLTYAYIIFQGTKSLDILEQINVRSLEALANLAMPFEILLITFLMNIIYNIYLYYKDGVTIGYKILGIKIISQKTGEKPKAGVLFGRSVFKFIMLAIPFLNIVYLLVGAGMILYKKNRQAPHDVLFKTLVVVKKVKRVWLIWIVNLMFVAVAVLWALVSNLLPLSSMSVQLDKVNKEVVKTQLVEFLQQVGVSYISNGNSYKSVCRDLKLKEGFECNNSENAWVIKDKNSGMCIDSEEGQVKDGGCLIINESAGESNPVENEEVFQG